MERILQKIGRINEYLSIIEPLKDDCLNRFDKDALYRGALLHYLYLLADTSITLAEMVIKKKELRPPQSYSEAFDILGEHNILDPQFAYSFARIAGFRNFLAHDYETTDAKIICNKVLSSTSDVKRYIEQIKKSITVP